MVSRRNFISITIMMGVLLFMFQFSQVIREDKKSYGVNIYASAETQSGKDRWAADGQSDGEGGAGTGAGVDARDPQGTGAEAAQGSQGDGAGTDAGTDAQGAQEQGSLVCGTAALISESGSSVENIVSQWCEYTKRRLILCASSEEVNQEADKLPEVVLVDSDAISVSEEVPTFEKLTKLGVTLIFCNLPSPQVIRQDARLRDLLGIQRVMEDSVKVEGVHLFGGFLLGGESYYIPKRPEEEKLQDLELEMPWYINTGGTKTYMVGMLDDRLKNVEAKNEFFPGILWRNGHNNAMVFVVNGDYMETMMGIGILDAMMYEAGPYALYPVVNAQNITVTNFPGFAAENNEKMMELYSRDAKDVFRDLCWPALSGMARRNQYRMTCLMTAQYDYSDDEEPTADDYEFYLQQFREINAEAGLSLEYSSDTDLESKLSEDYGFYESLGSDYKYSAVYAAEKDLDALRPAMETEPLLADVRTIASRMHRSAPIVDYYDDDTTLQNITAVASVHKYSDNLQLKCHETALGYSNVIIDMHKVLWPEGEEDRWENSSEDMVSNLNTYWRVFSAFDKTTLSESDARIRDFLNLSYRDEREQDAVRLEVFGTDEAWFLLRTHGERIASVEGGEYSRAEEGSYLIHSLEPVVEIRLEQDRGVMSYEPGQGLEEEDGG